jgi:hypothetical protein
VGEKKCEIHSCFVLSFKKNLKDSHSIILFENRLTIQKYPCWKFGRQKTGSFWTQKGGALLRGTVSGMVENVWRF